MNQDSVAIVTGANSGIGKAAAFGLAQLGVHVVMVCRNAERGEKALFELVSKTGGSAELMICDLASLKSVEDFCDRFLTKHSRLDVLVNNAGTIFPRRCETEDGFESSFQVNFLSHFLLTNRLLPLLVKSAPARIVNLTSVAHRFSKLRFDDIHLEKGYNWWRGYAQSKLAIVMSTYSLAKKLEGTGVTVNCIHPGVVGTDIMVNRESGAGALLARIQNMLFMSSEQGAEPVVRLAASDEYAGVTGRYYSHSAEKRSSRRSHDTDDAVRLCNMCESLCGLCGTGKEPEAAADCFKAKELVT